jgi:hypothetical protein
MCPGKNRWPGRQEWIKRTIDAVEIFGKGHVYTQIVAGVELSQPNGFKSIDAALESNFQGCEFFARRGVVSEERNGKTAAHVKTSELKRTIEKYPNVSSFIILKLSMLLNGAILTLNALDAVQNDTYAYGSLRPVFRRSELKDANNRRMPGAILLRDATSVEISFENRFENPYQIDWDGEKFLLLDDDVFIDTIDFAPRPKYYGKKTSRGAPMEAIAYTWAQRMVINAYKFCHLWETGDQCKYCACFTDTSEVRKVFAEADAKDGRRSKEVSLDDISETVKEALKERGRISEIHVTGGLDYSGDELYENEVNRYIRILREISDNFEGRFPSQLMAPAYTKKQLRRIYDETGLVAYVPNIEIWDEKISNWICPGKSRWPGHKEWIKRTIDAVEIFGKGNVYTQFVTGVELAEPYGFKSMEEALESNFQACEFYAKNGVTYVSKIWRPEPSSALGKQKLPSLDYCTHLVDGLYKIHKEYGLGADHDDYRHCGNHADIEMDRVD